MYADSISSSYVSSSDDDSVEEEWSFEADEYSGVEDSVGFAVMAEAARARYVSSFLGNSAISDVKEGCVEDGQIGSIDMIVASIF